MQGSRLSESLWRSGLLIRGAADPASDRGVYVCAVLGSGLWTGSHFPDQDTPKTPGVGSLEDIPRGYCALPCSVTSLMVCTCCSSSLNLATPDPTCIWKTSLAKNTVLQQTDHMCWTLGQASPAAHPHPAPRPGSGFPVTARALGFLYEAPQWPCLPCGRLTACFVLSLSSSVLNSSGRQGRGRACCADDKLSLGGDEGLT